MFSEGHRRLRERHDPAQHRPPLRAAPRRVEPRGHDGLPDRGARRPDRVRHRPRTSGPATTWPRRTSGSPPSPSRTRRPPSRRRPGRSPARSTSSTATAPARSRSARSSSTTSATPIAAPERHQGHAVGPGRRRRRPAREPHRQPGAADLPVDHLRRPVPRLPAAQRRALAAVAGAGADRGRAPANLVAWGLDLKLSPITAVGGPLVVAACTEFTSLILLRYLEERRRGLLAPTGRSTWPRPAPVGPSSCRP